jgi:phage tail-like protein
VSLGPLFTFRFGVEFHQQPLPPPPSSASGDCSSRGAASDVGAQVALCRGAFSEVSGLESSMEVKTIKEGGLNYGAAQRVGPISFSTVILKRGIFSTQHLWKWFDLLGAQGKAAFRLRVRITLNQATLNPEREIEDRPVYSWLLHRALPTKFKTADFNAAGGTSLPVEELHLVHEGLELEEGGS